MQQGLCGLGAYTEGDSGGTYLGHKERLSIRYALEIADVALEAAPRAATSASCRVTSEVREAIDHEEIDRGGDGVDIACLLPAICHVRDRNGNIETRSREVRLERLNILGQVGRRAEVIVVERLLRECQG